MEPVTNAVQPTAKLKIEDETYELVFDYNSIAEAESQTGCNLLHGISAALVGTMSAAQLRGLLYAALKPRHSQITLKAAGDLIRIDLLPHIYAALSEAWSLSMPELKKNPSEAEDPPAVN